MTHTKPHFFIHRVPAGIMRLSLAILCVMFVDFAKLTACPACKDGFSANSAQAAIGETYSWTILLLLAVPAIASGVIVWKIRNAMQAKEQASSMVVVTKTALDHSDNQSAVELVEVKAEPHLSLLVTETIS